MREEEVEKLHITLSLPSTGRKQQVFITKPEQLRSHLHMLQGNLGHLLLNCKAASFSNFIFYRGQKSVREKPDMASPSNKCKELPAQSLESHVPCDSLCCSPCSGARGKANAQRQPWGPWSAQTYGDPAPASCSRTRRG